MACDTRNGEDADILGTWRHRGEYMVTTTDTIGPYGPYNRTYTFRPDDFTLEVDSFRYEGVWSISGSFIHLNYGDGEDVAYELELEADITVLQKYV